MRLFDGLINCVTLEDAALIVKDATIVLRSEYAGNKVHRALKHLEKV